MCKFDSISLQYYCHFNHFYIICLFHTTVDICTEYLFVKHAAIFTFFFVFFQFIASFCSAF